MNQEILKSVLGNIAAFFKSKPILNAYVKPKIQFENEVEIEFLVVSSDYRGKGIGAYLIEYVCKNFPYDFCFLEVFSKNSNAIRFYDRLGFKQVKVESDPILIFSGIGKTITMKLNTKDGTT